MSDVFFYLFLLICVGLLTRIIVKPELIFEYPFFIAGIFFVFIVPQSIIIMNQPNLVPADSIPHLFLMCFLCLFMSVLGYYYAPPIKLGKLLEGNLDERKLKTIAIVFMFLGYIFSILTRNEVEENTYSTQWSGTATIYVQFAQIINIAFPIFLYFAFRKPNLINIVLALGASLPTLYTILLGGRRESTALFLITIALTVFFTYRIKPPRIIVVGMLLITMLIIPAIGDYRKLSEKEGPLAAAANLDLQESFRNYFKEGQYLELGVAAHIIDSYLFHGEYGYGAGYWDQMVFRYVPAQIIGVKEKEALKLDKRGIIFKDGYSIYPGLTITGVGDSFINFGYLGALFFFFLGGLFKDLWIRSLNGNNLLIRILYMTCFIQAMLSVTHATVNFLPGIFFYFLCLWLASKYAKV